MEQLTFELAPAAPPTFTNFAVGRNAEAVAALRRLAAGQETPAVVFVWGAVGAGCSHLLQATVEAARAAGRAAAYCPTPAAAPGEPPDVAAIVAVDAIATADALTQGTLFTLFNRLADTGGTLVAAASLPPARIELRADVRSRLGSGLVYEIVPLRDEEKPAALAAYAEARGMRLDPDVIAYLLVHGRRDMPSLLATLDALDRRSLAAQRPVTLALARTWLHASPGGDAAS
ncbi:MAG: DnaA regulatory inactivator Hda [Burkholderiales bacterium]|nr:DnaA regulatory inactivator Hda [Burkholderiales bacterium]